MTQAGDIAGSSWWSRLVNVLKAVVKFLLWFVFLAILARVLWSWTFGGVSYSILPFTTTAVQQSTLGIMVSDMVTFELKRISELHDPESMPWSFRGESLPHKQTLESKSFQKVGTVGVAGTVIPVGEVLLALKNTWPHFGERSVISGSVHSFATENGQQHIKIIVRQESQEKILNQWSIDRTISEQIEIAELAKDLAYQIHHDTGTNIGTRSWESFKFLSEAMEPAGKYSDGHGADDLAEAKRLLHLALQHDGSYILAHYALGQLYYRNGFYRWDEEKDGSYLRLPGDVIDSEIQLAKKEFERITDLSEKPEEKVLAYFGLGTLCVDQADLTPCRWQDICDKEAKTHFEVAVATDPGFWPASIGLAYAFELEHRYEDAINELQDLKDRTELNESAASSVNLMIADLQDMPPSPEPSDPDCEDDSDDDWPDDDWPDELDDWSDDEP